MEILPSSFLFAVLSAGALYSAAYKKRLYFLYFAGLGLTGFIFCLLEYLRFSESFAVLPAEFLFLMYICRPEKKVRVFPYDMEILSSAVLFSIVSGFFLKNPFPSLFGGVMFSAVWIFIRFRDRNVYFSDACIFSVSAVLILSVFPSMKFLVYQSVFLNSALCILYLIEKTSEKKKTFVSPSVKASAVKETKLISYGEKIHMSSDIKDEFIRQTSARLSDPLKTINMISENLYETLEGLIGEIQHRQIDTIRQISSMLKNVIHNIEDYLRIKNNILLTEPEIISLSAAVSLGILSAKPIIKNRRISVISQIPEKIGNVCFDENRLQQVIFDILCACVNYTDEGMIEISAERTEGFVNVFFHYPGSKLSPEKIRMLFSPYEESLEPESVSQFTGNLYVAEKIAELHGGFLNCTEDRAGFLLRIPSANELTGIRKERRPKDWAEFVLASSEQPEMKNDTRTHILVVDDEVSVLNLVRNYLETNGFRVSTAVTADEGVVKAGTLLPNLVLLDLGLPGSNGYEVTQQIRRKHSFSHMPIIIMTVRETMEEALQGLEFGANDFILKPISVQNLVARVKICLKISDINGSYERFVPPELVKLLKKQNITDVFLGDHVEREITILFSDIRSFTKISEEMTPGETFSFLNEYLERVGPVIKRNRGFIDKYIGDAIMAIFPFSADDAVRAAIQMQKEIYQLNAELFAAGKKTIRVGIGIHTGDVILGTIGEEERMEGTVISDAVNLTSRLENLTKLYGTNILISMDTFLNLDVPEEYNFRILDRVKVKGKNKLVTVIEIFDGLEPERMGMAVSTKTLFEEAVAHYLSRDFQTAIDGFMQILDVNPKDNAAMIYVQRAEYYMNSVLPENWDGSENLEEKYF